MIPMRRSFPDSLPTVTFNFFGNEVETIEKIIENGDMRDCTNV